MSSYDTSARDGFCSRILIGLPQKWGSQEPHGMQAILNALDGVGSGEGIVIVAAADEPTLLDPAILTRPGRFDRLVHFGNPDAKLRFEFLQRSNPLSSVQNWRK